MLTPALASEVLMVVAPAVMASAAAVVRRIFLQHEVSPEFSV
jgi:hypothetical protein